MKKIAAIHDLSGYGRASLTVAIPILTHMGFQVCPLPTAILSAHSEYKDFRSLDLTDYMESFISHWKELQLQFDAIYTGYLASVKQMGIVRDFFEHFKNDQNFILVDPVLGDHGELYSSMTPDMVEGMRKLCSQAKVITTGNLRGNRNTMEQTAERARPGTRDYHLRPRKQRGERGHARLQPIGSTNVASAV